MPNSYNGSDIRPRLLLVDDEDSVRNSLYSLFENDGYEVLAASNGTDGLAIYRHSVHPIELLVTDYNMPGMSGLELARECTRLHRELGVLYISGSPPDEELRRDLQGCRRGFIAKPFHARDLLRKARELSLTGSTAVM
ncbi:MAG TPA: response regulator [Bryobacteraceae bacterium]|nr:response regulator [Bryobacteraceae bacterium]